MNRQGGILSGTFGIACEPPRPRNGLAALPQGFDMVIIMRPRILIICYGFLFFIAVSISVAADSAPATQPAAQSKRFAPYPYPIGAGVLGLAAGSTDIIVADVLKQTRTRRSREPGTT